MLRHLAILAVLGLDLWLGGAMVDDMFGSIANRAFEVVLLAGYLLFVLGIGLPARTER